MTGARERLEAAIEAAIETSDRMDGDPDLEAQCEDGGWDSDTEPLDECEGPSSPFQFGQSAVLVGIVR